jgi:hypothetical protein
MDDSMKRVVREMRWERCPKRVLGSVRSEIGAMRARDHSLVRMRLVAGVCALVALVCVVSVLLAPRSSPEEVLVESDSGEIQQESSVHEVYASLASIGMALEEAGTRSGTIILQQTLPLLRQGLETTQQVIKKENKP